MRCRNARVAVWSSRRAWNFAAVTSASQWIRTAAPAATIASAAARASPSATWRARLRHRIQVRRIDSHIVPSAPRSEATARMKATYRCGGDCATTMLRGIASEASRPESIPIMIRLERACGRHADVARLLVGHPGEPGADLVEMQPRDLLVEVLGQRV